MNELFEKNIKFLYNNLPHYYELIKNIKKRNFLIKDNNIYYQNIPLYPNNIEEDSLRFSFQPTHNPNWIRKFYYIYEKEWERKFYITGKIINKLIKKAKSLNYTKDGFYFDKDFLPTTLILGMLSGKHIQNLIEKYHFQSLFIYEPNPEFFAISLYFIDYEKMYKKIGERLFLWINGEIDYFAIDKFFYERTITSSFLTLELSTYNHPLIEDAKRKFEEVRSAKIRGWGTYEDEIVGVKNHLKNNGKYPTLISKKELNAPFCIVANGKSLEKNLEFIRNNQNSMIIVSVGTAIKPLIKAGIESDFHIEQERSAPLFKALKDILPSYNGYFIGSNVVSPEIFNLSKNPLMYIREAFSLSTHFTLKGSSPIVGNAGFAFGANFTNEIYLCGMDLGYRLNQKKHASNSFYDNRNDIAKDGIRVKGNFSNDIYSDSLLLSSKRNIERLIKEKKLKVYNLSDGAFIEGSIPLKSKKLPSIDKERAKKEILSCFKKIEFELPPINLLNVLIPFKNTLNKRVFNFKELTGLVDFLEDSINSLSQKHPIEYGLLRGSLFHILNNFYILSHKVKIKNAKFLQNIIISNITDFEKDFRKFYPK